MSKHLSMKFNYKFEGKKHAYTYIRSYAHNIFALRGAGNRCLRNF